LYRHAHANADSPLLEPHRLYANVWEATLINFRGKLSELRVADQGESDITRLRQNTQRDTTIHFRYEVQNVEVLLSDREMCLYDCRRVQIDSFLGTVNTRIRQADP